MSQEAQILAALLEGQSLTPASAYERFGTLALHSRIASLRRQGYRIRCTMMQSGTKKWGVYTLDREAPKGQVEMFHSALTS